MALWKVRIQHVEFVKQKKVGEVIRHRARIITHVNVPRHKLIPLLTNDMESNPDEIIAIYRQRWEIELLFKQIKLNFSLKYFYGESANAIKIQIWVTLIANLLLMVMQKGLTRKWSFSGLSTMLRIPITDFLGNPLKGKLLMDAAKLAGSETLPVFLKKTEICERQVLFAI